MSQTYRRATHEEQLAAIRKEPGAKAIRVKIYTPRYDGKDNEFEFGLPPSYFEEADAWYYGADRVVINKEWIVEDEQQ